MADEHDSWFQPFGFDPGKIAAAVEDTASAAAQAVSQTASAAAQAATDTVAETASAATAAVEQAGSAAVETASSAVATVKAPPGAEGVVEGAVSSAVETASAAVKTTTEALSSAAKTVSEAASAPNPAKDVQALVDVVNTAEEGAVTTAVDYATEQGVISQATAQTIKNVEQVAQGIRQGAGDLVGSALNTAANPLTAGAQLIGVTAENAYEEGGGGVTGVLNAAVALSPGVFMNPIPHAVDAAGKAYEAGKRGDYKEAGRQATSAAADAAAVAGALGEGGAEPAPEDAQPKGRSKGAEEGNFQRISDANKAELQESGWLKERLKDPENRRQFMDWLEDRHKVEAHEHVSPGSPRANALLDEWLNKTHEGKIAGEREAAQRQREADELENRRVQIETETPEEMEERVAQERAEAEAQDLMDNDPRGRRARRRGR
jgi:hypothetical protein